MLCSRCRDKMQNVMHFENDKNYAFHYCKRCNQPTHKKRIHFEELEQDKSSKNKTN